MGHMHEVLSGDVYWPQTESVPEQTWSSAGFLTSAVQGLLGLSVDSVNRAIVFAPHLPNAWPVVSITNIQLAETHVSLSLRRVSDGFLLQIDNPTVPFHLEFAPEIPLGSQLRKADMNRKPVTAMLHTYLQDQHATVNLDVPQGESKVHLGFTDGVSVNVPTTPILIGNPSVGLHLESLILNHRKLTIVADVPRDRDSPLYLKTRWTPSNGQESTVWRVADGSLELIFNGRNSMAAGTSKYVRVTTKVEFISEN
jgi:hypothetical protein